MKPKKKKAFCIYLDEENLDLGKRLAEAKNRSFTNLMETLLIQALKRNGLMTRVDDDEI